MQRRNAFRAAAAASLAAPLGSWADQAPSSDARTLSVVGPWEIGGLAPALSGHTFQRLGVLDTLLDVSPQGQPQAAVARSWAVAADGLSWRLELQAGRRFHDGSAVDAPAVVRSLRAAAASPAALSWAPIARIEAVGDASVVIALKSPYAALWAVLAHSSSGLLAPSAFNSKGEVVRLIGCGAYRVHELQAPQRAALQAVDSRTPIQLVRYLAAGRAETRALMAQAGEVDLAIGLDPASWQRLKGRPNVALHEVLLPRTALVKVNTAHPWLADARMRQALSAAIDRRGIAHAVFRDTQLAATQLIAPALAQWHNPALAPLAFDLAQARQKLAACGWQSVSINGEAAWRNARGDRLALTLRTFPDRPELPMIATALQEQWRQLGIAVQVVIGNSGDVPRGHRDGSLELALLARNHANIAEPSSTLLQDFGRRERAGQLEWGGDWGAMGWRDAQVADGLLQIAQGREAPELRAQTTARIHGELPLIPIAWHRLQVATSRRVAGVVLDPFERSYFLTQLRWAPGATA
jgi:peptide/nickel transport system substrate-binding protein